jgi:hypothetical protein
MAISFGVDGAGAPYMTEAIWQVGKSQTLSRRTAESVTERSSICWYRALVPSLGSRRHRHQLLS